MLTNNDQKGLDANSVEARASSFWRHAFAIQGSITPHVMPNVLIVGAVACIVCITSWLLQEYAGLRLAISVAPFEFTGVALGLLLVLRTNSGYERWWEARKLWGGIVNQSRNLAISGLTYGPRDSKWQAEFVKWVAVFPHVARASLRGQPPPPEVEPLVGEGQYEVLAQVDHMPSAVAVKLAGLLRQACDEKGMDRFAFIQIDKERAQLIDHIGACERILKTPLAKAYSIKIRRFIAIFILTLPLALIHELEFDWLVPLLTMLVAYPLLSLDQLGVELQNPFHTGNLSHLPLDDISATIERNVLSLLATTQDVETAGALRQ
jgi:putative membrane protein